MHRAVANGSYDVALVRQDFPALAMQIYGKPLVYLDNAASAQKPNAVLDRMTEAYKSEYANVHRGLHYLANAATEAYEGARGKVAQFINARRSEEIVFTRNVTEAINLVASSWGGVNIKEGDEIVLSIMEHHSNIVPWQMVCERTGATLRWFDITDDGRLDLEKADAEHLINERTKVVSVVWVSNVLGTRNPMAEIARRAHAAGATLVVDGSQAVPHQRTDVATLGADLLAFTAHKLCGPTGIGVLWGRGELLAQLPPFLGGGEMIEIVEMERSTFAPPPYRFEAGTPPIAQAVGLGAALDYLDGIGMEAIEAHEQELTEYALGKLTAVDGLQILGPTEAVERGSAVSFNLDGVHPHDVMQVLDSRGIAIRGGHHCARPLHKRLGHQSSTRASSYLYTTPAEIDALVDALVFTRNYFAPRF